MYSAARQMFTNRANSGYQIPIMNVTHFASRMKRLMTDMATLKLVNLRGGQLDEPRPEKNGILLDDSRLRPYEWDLRQWPVIGICI